MEGRDHLGHLMLEWILTCEGVDWIQLGPVADSCDHDNISYGFKKGGDF